MLHNLSQREQEALIELGNHGSGGQYDDQATLSRLFTLQLVAITDDRRIVLTEAGRMLWVELTE